MKKIIFQYHFWIMGILTTFLSSCNTKHRVWVGEGNEQKIFNLSYGENKQQKMDIFLPNQYSEDVPVVVLVHGGAWKFGRKEHMIHIQKFLHRNQIPSVNIDYRLVKKNLTYKDQLSDIGLALEKFNSFSSKTKLPKNKFILLGESAGGHLALLYGYQNPQIIAKIISLSAPTDFYSKTFLKSTYSRYTSPTIQKVVGEKLNRENLPEAFKEASPIEQVTNVPTLLFQGESDFLVNKKQALTLDSVLTEKQIPHQLILMKNTGHAPRFFSKKKRDQIIYPKILQWIKGDSIQ